MIQKLSLLSVLIISASCMFIHPSPPIALGLQRSYPTYDFAYAVHDEATGDIKNQYEIRRGDAVVGQYSLDQPDGLRRTVGYRADDHSGFNADVDISPVNRGHEAPAPTERTSTLPPAVSRSSLVLHVPNRRTLWV